MWPWIWFELSRRYLLENEITSAQYYTTVVLAHQRGVPHSILPFVFNSFHSFGIRFISYPIWCNKREQDEFYWISRVWLRWLLKLVGCRGPKPYTSYRNASAGVPRPHGHLIIYCGYSGYNLKHLRFFFQWVFLFEQSGLRGLNTSFNNISVH